jgi:type VI secretion system protein ImpH
MGTPRRPQAAALSIVTSPPIDMPDDADTRAETQPYLRALLTDAPNSVRFVQLVRLLEQLAPERSEVGGTGDPSREVVKFSVPPTMAFPASEVQQLELADATSADPSQLSVNFLGLTGPLGVMPLLYTQLVADRLRARDRALAEFLDIFHHRLLSLHYRAWAKYRPGVAPLDGSDDVRSDRMVHHLLDLAGIGTDGLQQRLAVPDAATAYYAGLLGPVQRSAAGLEQLIADHFAVPVEVVQFVGGWYHVERADRTAIGEERDGSSQLGRGALAGDEVWDQQARIRIRLGPLSRVDYERFLPTGSSFGELESLVRFYTDDRFALDVQLVMARHAIPPTILGDAQSLPLMWGTWLASSRAPTDRDDTVLPLTAGTVS